MDFGKTRAQNAGSGTPPDAQSGGQDEHGTAQQRRADEVTGLPVVLVTSGELQGKVRQLFFSSSQARLLGLTLERGAGLLHHGQILALRAGDIQAIGKDAVTIASADALLHEPGAAQALEQEAGDGAVGKKVMTEGGKLAGTVEDVVFDPATGDIVAYEVSGGTWQDMRHGKIDLSIRHVISVGPDVVVIREVL